MKKRLTIRGYIRYVSPTPDAATAGDAQGSGGLRDKGQELAPATILSAPSSSASLLFAGLYKEKSKDKERVDRKGGDEFPLEKSKCAEYQARCYEDYQEYGNRAIHGISGFDSLSFYVSGVL